MVWKSTTRVGAALAKVVDGGYTKTYVALLTTRKYERTLRGERAAFGLIGKVFIYVLVPIVAPHYTRKFKRI